MSFEYEDLIKGNKLGQVFGRVNTALGEIEAGSVEDGDITNAKLATDVKVGSLAALTTTEKGSVQGAVNEVVEKIGDLATLDTTAKNNVVAAINEVKGLADISTIQNATPVNAVAASKVLTISGVVIHGETVEIGSEVYQFASDVAQTVDEGNIAVDIEGDATKSTGTLTVDTQPTAGDKMTIGEKVYTFVPVGTANADGEISVADGLPNAKIAIVEAILGTDGHNDPNPVASCAAEFSTHDLTITALIGGVAGDAIATTSVFTEGTNQFAAATLGSGADCINTDASDALKDTIVAESDIVTATEDGGAVTVTAKVKGVSGNSIEISEDMANGAFAGAATELSGGVNGTVGSEFEVKVDANYLYVCTAENTIADANWKRSAVSSY